MLKKRLVLIGMLALGSTAALIITGHVVLAQQRRGIPAPRLSDSPQRENQRADRVPPPAIPGPAPATPPANAPAAFDPYAGEPQPGYVNETQPGSFPPAPVSETPQQRFMKATEQLSELLDDDELEEELANIGAQVMELRARRRLREAKTVLNSLVREFPQSAAAQVASRMLAAGSVETHPSNEYPPRTYIPSNQYPSSKEHTPGNEDTLNNNPLPHDTNDTTSTRDDTHTTANDVLVPDSTILPVPAEITNSIFNGR